MEENKNINSQENAIVQEQPKKKGNAALILGIIGTSAGVLALLLVIVGFFFGNARYNMMNRVNDDRNGRIEQRGGYGDDGNFCRGFRR